MVVIMLVLAGPDCNRAPRLLRIGKRAQGRGNLARRLVAELVTVTAAVQLDDVEPLLLALKSHRHAVAFEARTGEQALVRNVEHGKPINGRIVLRRCRRIGAITAFRSTSVPGSAFTFGESTRP